MFKKQGTKPTGKIEQTGEVKPQPKKDTKEVVAQIDWKKEKKK